MRMDKKGITELLERYQNNTCTVEEKKIVEEWFDAQSAAGQWNWDGTDELTTKLAIKNRVDHKLFGKKYPWMPVLRIAAMFVLVLGAVLYFKQDLHNLIDPIAFVQKNVKDGQRLTLTLADGTRVWLNSGSKFSYPNRFDEGNREVFLLEGEAYFDVSHDPSHPFVVVSQQLRTKVLGTAFNVKAYSDLSAMQVAVTRGKVQVSDTTGKSVLLLPDQQVSFDKLSRAMDKQTIDAKTSLAWQQGGVSFNNDRMLDVCTVLSKKYHINFLFGNADIKDYRLTAGFETTDHITTILTVLASANNLSYTVNNQTVTLYKK